MPNRRESALARYMRLPYKIEIIPDEDMTSFTAVVPELEGCMAFGETIEEAYEMITEAKKLWIETALEEGWAIPEPAEEEVKEYSGRFNVRLPRYLHRRLAELAEVEETSLNQLVVALLSEGVERRRQARRMERTRVIKPFGARGFALLFEETVESARASKRTSVYRQRAPWHIPDNISVQGRGKLELCD